MSLLDIKSYDKSFYEERIKAFIPDRIIDCHNHIWLPEHIVGEDTEHRSQNWPGLVADSNSIEDLNETNKLLFPGKKVISVLYGQVSITIDREAVNDYVAQSAEKNGFPALYLSHPSEANEHIRMKVTEHRCFKGLKVYLQFAPSYIPAEEIRIYDFITPEQLKLANEMGWVVQIHIPRSGRLADPVNYIQLKEIEDNYPNITMIIAHLGRAYATEDIGNGLEYLKGTKRCIWDMTANTNEEVMYRVLSEFGPERFIYGTDFPVFRMKARRVVENGVYINEIPAGDFPKTALAGDKHMREIEYPEAEKLTFFVYEEIDACRRACERLGLNSGDVDNIFYGNSAKLFGIK